jgi:hypothetical protein
VDPTPAVRTQPAHHPEWIFCSSLDSIVQMKKTRVSHDHERRTPHVKAP